MLSSCPPTRVGGELVTCMPYTFRTPYVKEGPIGDHRLFYFYKMNRGVSLVKLNNQYVEIRFPSSDTLAQSSEYYIGGSEYTVSDATAAELTAAGYGSNLTLIQ